MRPEPVRKSFAGRRRLAKRTPCVQQRGHAFPLRMAVRRAQKEAAGIRRLFSIRKQGQAQRLQPFRPAATIAAAVAARAAVAVIAPIAVTAVIAVEAMPPASAAAEPAFHAGENRKPPLLAVVERLVERV